MSGLGLCLYGEEDMNHVGVGRGGGRNTLKCRERKKWFDC